MKTTAATLAILALTPALLAAQTQHPEKWYQAKWCNEHKGRTEQILADGTRADCTTNDNIVEFDFDKKWAEAIGQALHYSQQSGQKAGIVLIIEKGEAGRRHEKALRDTVLFFHLPVDVWTVGK